MTLKNYIQTRPAKQYKVGHIEVSVKDPHPSDIDTKSAISSSLKKIPSHLLRNLRAIRVGNFPELRKRSIQGLYRDSEIVLSNEHETEEDIHDDIVHEVAHSVEEIYWSHLYSDKKMEKEFLEKRKKLWMQLDKTEFNTPLENLLSLKYSAELDHFFYKTVGYGVLRMLTTNLFYSPYAATSLREYFANGFEAFFMKEDISRLKSISPELYKKIISLLDVE